MRHENSGTTGRALQLRRQGVCGHKLCVEQRQAPFAGLLSPWTSVRQKEHTGFRATRAINLVFLSTQLYTGVKTVHNKQSCVWRQALAHHTRRISSPAASSVSLQRAHGTWVVAHISFSLLAQSVSPASVVADSFKTLRV